jgi:2-polyprenyl-3-methyl-5-hydroxy-6-metoxy-1,4-benzoquinol methylase
MKAKPISRQKQIDRDIELAHLTGVSLEDVQKIVIASPETIAIYKGDGSDLNTPEDVVALYHDFKYIDWVGYLKTLMFTSMYKRGRALFPFLESQKGKKCLDYGSGVASHTILLAELGNDISILDVEGPAADFAVKRIISRGHTLSAVYNPSSKLPRKKFDVILNVECLEHVPDPMKVMMDMYESLRVGGQMYLRYSTMVKDSSGHFRSSITEIKSFVPAFLAEHYKSVSPRVYEKIK